MDRSGTDLGAGQVSGDAGGQHEGVEHLVPLLYVDLERMARRERHRVSAAETLCTTALINEAYLKLRRSALFRDRQHFLCCAALAMRQVLVNYALLGRCRKRGAGARHLSLENSANVAVDIVREEVAGEDVLDVHEALQRLEQFDPRMAQVVTCRFFAGYDELETAEALAISERTVRREWLQAKAWLHWQLKAERAN
jgi:RNA polymerase sigma factor (TIGR02999 family)